MEARAERRRVRRRNQRIVLVVVVLAMVGGYVLYTRTANAEEPIEEPTLQTTTVRKGDIVLTAVGSGNLMPVAEIALGFRTSGTLTDLVVGVGDTVSAGQVLAQLDSATAEIQVKQAALALEQAEAKLADTRRTETQTIEIADADLEAAQAAYEALVSRSASVGTQLTSVRVNLEQAEEALVAAEAAYAVAWDPGRDWELAVKQMATALENEREASIRSLEKAKDDLEIARANYSLAVLNLEDNGATQSALSKLLTAQQHLDDLQSGADLQAAEWAVRQAELSLASAELTLSNTILTAPTDGTVVGVAVHVGETAGTSPVITIADLDTVQVRFYLEESDLDKVNVGNRVTTVFDALPNDEFIGEVVRVDPALVSVEGTQAVQAWAELTLPEDQAALPSGLTAEVEIIAGEVYKTLLVPVQALRELAPGQFAVFVVDEAGELRLQPIEIGLRDFANVEVLSGLQQGDVVSTGTVETE
ncbi:MAG: efflux RND transporter periplasmic adaptor subunit [Anaerolineae bacterium]|nr:efflux RND transporter periplasmic adaptor subunit [Anaerolineae bacterium]